ncbi:ABC-2 transporter permease [Blautia schinkii]|nr:ABC-2 transporter permease [Blautia schinkii]
MRGLLIKDFYNLKKTMTVYVIMTIILSAYCAFTNKSSFVSINPILIFSTTITSTFSMDNSVKWDKLAVPAPLKRSDIVKSKYMLLLLIIAVGIGTGTVFALPVIFTKAITITAFVNMTLFSASIALCAGSLSLAFLYITHRGPEKIELIIIFAYAGAALIVIGFAKLLNLAAAPLDFNKIILSLINLLLVFLIFAVSCRISIRCYDNCDIC